MLWLRQDLQDSPKCLSCFRRNNLFPCISQYAQYRHTASNVDIIPYTFTPWRCTLDWWKINGHYQHTKKRHFKSCSIRQGLPKPKQPRASASVKAAGMIWACFYYDCLHMYQSISFVLLAHQLTSRKHVLYLLTFGNKHGPKLRRDTDWRFLRNSADACCVFTWSKLHGHSSHKCIYSRCGHEFDPSWIMIF